MRNSIAPSNNGGAFCKLKYNLIYFIARRDSIISPQDTALFESLVQNEDQFNLMFSEGLKESDAIDKDMLIGSNQQERIFNTK